MTLSSAEYTFKQFGPRSGLTFCLGLSGVQTIRHFRGYDKLKLNQCILTLLLPLHDIAENLYKQFGPRSGPDILSRPDRGPNYLIL